MRSGEEILLDIISRYETYDSDFKSKILLSFPAKVKEALAIKDKDEREIVISTHVSFLLGILVGKNTSEKDFAKFREVVTLIGKQIKVSSKTIDLKLAESIMNGF